MAGEDGDSPELAQSAQAEIDLEQIPLHSTNLLTLLDESGTIHYESPAIENIYGFEQDELIGNQVAAYFHPDDRERVVNAYARIVTSQEERTEAVEYRHEIADGSYLWVESVASTNPTPEGFYVINTRDISERKERERQLKRAHARVAMERDGKEAIQRLLLETATGRELAGTICRQLVEEYAYDASWIVQPVEGNSEVGWEVTGLHGEDTGFREETGDGVLDVATRHVLADGSPDSIAVTVTDNGPRNGLDENREDTEGDVTGEDDTSADDTGEDDTGGKTEYDSRIRGQLTEADLHSVHSVSVRRDGVTWGAITAVRGEPAEDSLGLLEEFAEALAFKQQIRRQQETLAASVVVEFGIRLSGGHFLATLSKRPMVPDETTIVAHELPEDEDTGTYLLESADVSPETLAAGANEVGAIDSVSRVAPTSSVISVRIEGPTLGAVVRRHGGGIDSITVSDGQVDVTAVFARLTDVDDLASALRDHWPEVRFRSRKQRTVEHERPLVFDSLTQKQEAALRAAVVSGFFDRPQGATADEVGDVMDVSRSTFLYHLRMAEGKVFSEIYGDPDR